MSLDTERKENGGKLPAYAWPGGYPILYLFADGGVCCPDCANGENGSDAYTEDRGEENDKQWQIIGRDINWEDESCFCDHCSKQIESAYGED